MPQVWQILATSQQSRNIQWSIHLLSPSSLSIHRLTWQTSVPGARDDDEALESLLIYESERFNVVFHPRHFVAMHISRITNVFGHFMVTLPHVHRHQIPMGVQNLLLEVLP